MNSKQSTFLALGALTAIAVVALPSGTPLQAMAPPPDRDVFVVNGATSPVPVTGDITVSGTSTVSGTVAATQSGPWTVGIDSAHNTVKVASSDLFFFDSQFSGMNDGQTVDVGPIDTSHLKQLRILARAINGDVHFKLLSDFPTGSELTLDEFTLDGESGNVSGTRVYDAPPPNITLRMTESGPGGANYHFVLMGN
jgi:hypothetical protein